MKQEKYTLKIKHSYIHISANIQFLGSFCSIVVQLFTHTMMQMCLWRPCVCGWDRGCMLSILWCVSESNALYLLTCFSGIYVIQLLYGANLILPREMSCFLTHNTLYWDPTEICSQTFDGGRLEIFRNWRSVKTLKTPWVFVSFSPSVAVLFFPVIPKPISLTEKTSAVPTRCCLRLPAAKQG